MDFDLPNAIALLSHTPAALDALLRPLPESWTLRNEGGNTMTPFDVVGHLVHLEKSNWIERATIILQYGETLTFPPVDRAKSAEGAALPFLLDEFTSLRTQNLDALYALNLQPEDLAKRGHHPIFGPVTLSQLLATWAAHDMTHLHQISRTLAHQYRDAVGPWIKFLGVLHCRGHSEAA
jgi:hypothetical protein